MKLILLQKSSFISFCKELSEINFQVKSDLNKLNETKMKNGISVKDNLVNLIAKIGEKITLEEPIILIIQMD